jgi:hypothetical protein
MKLDKEPEIGDILKEGKKDLQLVEGTNTCKGCHYEKEIFCPLFNRKLVCLAENRKDGKNAIFVKIKK